MVCHAQAMVGRQKNIGRKIVKIHICTSIGIGLASFIYRINTETFLTCMGRMELFVFDLSDPFLPLIGGDLIKLPLSNPFRLGIYVVGYAFILVLPFFITRFSSSDKGRTSLSKVCRKKTVERLSINQTITGIDEGARSRREQKNIFSARINCIAWIIEVLYYVKLVKSNTI